MNSIALSLKPKLQLVLVMYLVLTDAGNPNPLLPNSHGDASTSSVGSQGRNQPVSAVHTAKDTMALATLAETLHASQRLQSHLAATEAKEILAQQAKKWSQIAQILVTWKAQNVMELTRKAQAAQIQSLVLASVATRMKVAVMMAEIVYYNALNDFRAASTRAEAAAQHAKSLEEALQKLEIVSKEQSDAATAQSLRASKITSYLQDTFEDLKEAIKKSQEAYESFRMSSNFVVM